MPLRPRRAGMDMKLAEHAPEFLVLFERHLLIAEEDHLMPHKGVMDLLEGPVAERLRQVDIADLGADARRHRLDGDGLEGHGVTPPPLFVIVRLDRSPATGTVRRSSRRPSRARPRRRHPRRWR